MASKVSIAFCPTRSRLIFGLDMLDRSRRDHYRKLVGDMIVSYLTSPAGLPPARYG